LLPANHGWCFVNAVFGEHIMLSRTSKLGCYSWSLQAVDKCPASRGDDGELVEVCKGCYATQGFYHMPDAIALRERNDNEWRQDSWVDDMVKALRKQTHFRWFDSGDMYTEALAWKIHAVCEATPWCKHWLPTRMHKFTKFSRVIDALNDLDNVVVRFSSDNVGQHIDGLYVSLVVDAYKHVDKTHVCPSSLQGGKCLTCRACWSKDTQSVAYVAHSKKMGKIIRMKLES
jgi:hypothetical protein